MTIRENKDSAFLRTKSVAGVLYKAVGIRTIQSALTFRDQGTLDRDCVSGLSVYTGLVVNSTSLVVRTVISTAVDNTTLSSVCLFTYYSLASSLSLSNKRELCYGEAAAQTLVQ